MSPEHATMGSADIKGRMSLAISEVERDFDDWGVHQISLMYVKVENTDKVVEVWVKLTLEARIITV